MVAKWTIGKKSPPPSPLRPLHAAPNSNATPPSPRRPSSKYEGPAGDDDFLDSDSDEGYGEKKKSSSSRISSSSPVPPPRELTIREKYTFEPELYPDGTPQIDKIISRRLIPSSTSMPPPSPSKSTPQQHKEYEYHLKFKNKSFLHTSWERQDSINSMGRSAKMMFTRYLKKIDQGIVPEEVEIETSWVTVDRIVDEKETMEYVDMTEEEAEQFWKEEGAEEEEMDVETEDNEDDNEARYVNSLSDNSERLRVQFVDSKFFDPISPSTIKEHQKGAEISNLKIAISKHPPCYRIPSGSPNPYADGTFKNPPVQPRTAMDFYFLINPVEVKGLTSDDVETLQGETKPHTRNTRNNATTTNNTRLRSVEKTWEEMMPSQKEIWIELQSLERRTYEAHMQIYEKVRKRT